MTGPYETIWANGDGFTASTFGCSCCSQDVELKSPKQVMAALLETSEMYLEMSERYLSMYIAVSTVGTNAVCIALDKYRAYQRNCEAMAAALHHINEPGSAGQFGADCYKIGQDTLAYRCLISFQAMTPQDRALIKIFIGEEG